MKLSLGQQMICAECGNKTKFGEIQFTDYGWVVYCPGCVNN